MSKIPNAHWSAVSCLVEFPGDTCTENSPGETNACSSSLAQTWPPVPVWCPILEDWTSPHANLRVTYQPPVEAQANGWPEKCPAESLFPMTPWLPHVLPRDLLIHRSFSPCQLQTMEDRQRKLFFPKPPQSWPESPTPSFLSLRRYSGPQRTNLLPPSSRVLFPEQPCASQSLSGSCCVPSPSAPAPRHAEGAWVPTAPAVGAIWKSHTTYICAEDV